MCFSCLCAFSACLSVLWMCHPHNIAFHPLTFCVQRSFLSCCSYNATKKQLSSYFLSQGVLLSKHYIQRKREKEGERRRRREREKWAALECLFMHHVVRKITNNHKFHQHLHQVSFPSEFDAWICFSQATSHDNNLIKPISQLNLSTTTCRVKQRRRETRESSHPIRKGNPQNQLSTSSWLLLHVFSVFSVSSVSFATWLR